MSTSFSQRKVNINSIGTYSEALGKRYGYSKPTNPNGLEIQTISWIENYVPIAKAFALFLNNQQDKIKVVNSDNVDLVMCHIDELTLKYIPMAELLNVYILNETPVIFINHYNYNCDDKFNMVDELEKILPNLHFYVIDLNMTYNAIYESMSYMQSEQNMYNPFGIKRDNEESKFQSHLFNKKIIGHFVDWLDIIHKVRDKFDHMKRSFSTVEIQDCVKIVVDDKVTTFLKTMMTTHKQETEELISTTVSRVLKEKFESLSDSISRKYDDTYGPISTEEIPVTEKMNHEAIKTSQYLARKTNLLTNTDSNIPSIVEEPISTYEEIVKPINDEMEIVNKLEYIFEVIEKHDLNIYPNLPSLSAIKDLNDIGDHQFTDEDISKIEEMVSVISYINNYANDDSWKFIVDYNKNFPAYKDLFDSYRYMNERTDSSLVKAGARKVVDLFKLSAINPHKGYIYNNKGWWIVLREFVKSTGFSFNK